MSYSSCIHQWLDKHGKFKVLRHRPTKYHHKCEVKQSTSQQVNKRKPNNHHFRAQPMSLNDIITRSLGNTFILQPTTHFLVTSWIISWYLRCNVFGMNLYYHKLIGSYLSLNVSTVEGRRTTRNKGATGDDLECNFPIFTVKFERNYGRTSWHESEQSM